MDLQETRYAGGVHPVEGYGPGFFRIAGQIRSGPLLTYIDGPQDWAGLEDPDPLVALAGKVDVILFGMGADIAYLPDGLRSRLEALTLGCEIMASPPACRSYNVLLGEGRRVALAALPV